MSRHESPLTCCDWECAAANNCVIGGYQCEDCGCWFCSDEVADGDDGVTRCSDCANEYEERKAQEEQEAEDGE